MYNDKLMNFDSFIKHVEKKIYFRNVYLFVKIFKKINIIKKSDLIKNNV